MLRPGSEGLSEHMNNGSHTRQSESDHRPVRYQRDNQQRHSCSQGVLYPRVPEGPKGLPWSRLWRYTLWDLSLVPARDLLTLPLKAASGGTGALDS